MMKYKISSDYLRDGPPRWDVSEVLHVTPGDEFKTITDRELDRLTRGVALDERRREYVDKLRRDAGDKLTRRLGWMTRAHPSVGGHGVAVADSGEVYIAQLSGVVQKFIRQ